LRFDNVPSGWSDSSTERFSGWDIIPTQVPNHYCQGEGKKRVKEGQAPDLKKYFMLHF
jgi:hypothetical protein